jgi:hypothetical protein
MIIADHGNFEKTITADEWMEERKKFFFLLPRTDVD